MSLVKRMAMRLVFEKEGEMMPADFYPEWPFVHYALPCLGTFFFELIEDESVEEKQLEWYLHFVHRLICSYQKNPRYPSAKYTPHLTNLEGKIFLLHKAEQIRSAISRAVFGSDKEENIFTRDGFSKFLQPWTEICSRPGKTAIRASLCFFFYRVDAVLRKCLPEDFFLPPAPRPAISGAITLCRMVAATAFSGQGYKDESFESLSAFLKVVFKNHLRANHNNLLHLKPKMDLMLEKMDAEAQELTEAQLLHLILYLSLNTLNNNNLSKKPKKPKHKEKLELCMDQVEKAFWGYMDGDLWRLKQCFSVCLGQNENCKVTAKKNMLEHYLQIIAIPSYSSQFFN